MNQSGQKPDSKDGTARNHAGNLELLISALGSKDKSVRGKLASPCLP